MKTRLLLAGYLCLLALGLSPFVRAAFNTAPATVEASADPLPRVTFHKPAAGDSVFALVPKYAGTAVEVRWEPSIRRADIAIPTDDGWEFQRTRMTARLTELKLLGVDRVMCDLEPIALNPGHERIDAMEDALGLAWDVLGQRVAVGFYGNPLHFGQPNERPFPRFFDGILDQQGAIYVACYFVTPGPNWFAKGITQTERLIERVEQIRDGRPAVAYVAGIRGRAGNWAPIEPAKLQHQFELIVDADIDISVASFGGQTSEYVAGVLKLAREVKLKSLD